MYSPLQERLRTKVAMREAPKHVLCVSFNKSLLKTREMMLRRRGYLVTSAPGSINDVETVCKTSQFDLFVLGHSIPLQEKAELIRTFRGLSQAPVLSLLRPGESSHDGADDHVVPDNPELLLDRIDAMLKGRGDAATM